MRIGTDDALNCSAHEVTIENGLETMAEDEYLEITTSTRLQEISHRNRTLSQAK